MLTEGPTGGYEEIGVEDAQALVADAALDLKRQGNPPIRALQRLGLSQTDPRQFRALDENAISAILLTLLLDGRSTTYIVISESGEDEAHL
ncbi:MAG: hypothetical protein A2756_00070 [Candidatus Ryanbacteria bacterium RIFCSPHIGHO2_01_FULL_48_27]|uniref:Uncharacterized protein n=1 Tax=Candidatus Ryanbacteria bacterium RIFCSPHIGHO2_01_FULL_48_27 TaxID=1802115 RepID=A0A1G2FZT5_9BACT|nr:MAG: hypothetical protein A2756_00070 [Candidatus Ryanbacteria bacterium RIFCSPHIGHO2_01_FULL_48_27]